MKFKEKLAKKYSEAYIDRYGDRLTQVQGRVLSVKVEEKSFLKILNKLLVTIVIKPEGSKNVIKSIFKKKRWFKKIDFISVLQGHSVIIQGLKGDKSKKKKKSADSKEIIEIVNIRNLTTRKDLVPIQGNQPKVQRVRADRRFK